MEIEYEMNIVKKSFAVGAVIIATMCTLLTSINAQASIAYTIPDVRNFVGAWKGAKAADNSVILIRPLGVGGIGVRGQDEASVWDARCMYQNSGQFACLGTGETLSSGEPFVLHSTIEFKNSHIEETWSVYGLHDGKTETTSGATQFERITRASSNMK